MYKNAIVFYQNKLLLAHQNIFLETRLFKFPEQDILRRIDLNPIELIELSYYDERIENAQWLTPKEALHLIDMKHFSLLAKGLSIMQWDKHHQFCGACAKKTVLAQQSFERYCLDCNIKYYPKISPAIIVLIRRGTEILMARSAHFPPGVYALIAGFVEAGEALEAAVHREVFEEVGIKIKNLTYYGSQPWPFPDSLMMGFTAEYESGEIMMDQNEIEDAGWYPYNQLPGLPSFPMSIAFQMIQEFVCQHSERGSL